MVSCRPLDGATAVAWDRFVAGHPAATFFHRSAWAGLIEQVFEHRAYPVLAERDGTVCGVLPLVHVRTRLFGRSLASLPFCVYGGPLAADREAARALESYAADLQRKLGAPSLELRQREALPDGWLGDTDWATRDGLYATFRRAIAASDEANLKAIPRKQRAMVRKGIELGLRSEVSQDAGKVWPIYAESVRNLGTPVFPRRWFEALLAAFPGESDVVTILDGEEPIAAVLNFYWRGEVLPYYGGGTALARQRYGNDFLYWEVTRRAAARGCTGFDFGRSKAGTGAHAFKKNWGFEPEPLPYRYRLLPGASIPEHNPLNPKYKAMIAAWRRLPLPVANLLGPRIVRGLG
jgi:FemAB-related protein (PEP-CTERM system-associated)